MKRLLFLLFPVFSYGQIVIQEYSVGFQTLGIGSISSKTYEAGHLYIIFAGISNSSTPATVSLSGGSTTWTEIGGAGGVLNGSSFRRIQAFRYAPASNTTTSITITYTGSQDGGFAVGYDITNVDVGGTNGSNAIVGFQVGSGCGANPSLTMAALSSTGRNAVLSSFINSVNPFGGSPESGWTEYEDNGYAIPDTGGYVMYRIGTTDNTPTVTIGAGCWAGMAMELKANNRRIIITN